MVIDCGICKREATVEIVECDRCERPFHLKCVKEDEMGLHRVHFWRRSRSAKPVTIDSPLHRDPLRNDRRRDAVCNDERDAECSDRRRDAATPRASTNNAKPRAATSATTPPGMMEEISRLFRQVMEESRVPRGQRDVSGPRMDEIVDAVIQRLGGGNGPEASRGYLPSSTGFGATFDNHELSRSQKSARQAVNGKLPTFSGQPEEWARFEACFEETTRLCGFSDGENILRLQQALEGRALKAVQRRLRHAENLPEVMKTLRKMFGRPELVVGTLLEEIRNQQPPRMDKLDSLVDFSLMVEEVCATVRTSDVEHRFDGPLLQELVGRLPSTVQLMWGFHCLTLPAPGATLANFGAWMENAKDAVLILNLNPSSKSEKKTGTVRTVNVHSERWTFVKDHRLCKGCLKPHNDPCRISRACGRDGCQAKHHPSLHWNQKKDQAIHEGKPTPNLHHSSSTHGSVLLRHVPVTLHAAGRKIRTVALLDEGSAVTLIERDLLKELGVNGVRKPLCLSWTGGQHREERDSIETTVTISGTSESTLYEMPAVRSVKRIALPEQGIDMRQLTYNYDYLRHLPISSFTPTSPRLIIVMDNYHLTRPLKSVERNPGEPVATQTRLGWVVSGRCRVAEERSTASTPTFQIDVCDCKNLESRIEAAMKGTFTLEEPQCKNGPILASNQERAWQLLRATTQQSDDRYTTGLLWRHENVNLPDSLPMATTRLAGLEKRLKRETGLRAILNEKMSNYLAKGYIRKLTNKERATRYPRKWYLPVFPVHNPNKPNKVRLVWDAAAAVKEVPGVQNRHCRRHQRNVPPSSHCRGGSTKPATEYADDSEALRNTWRTAQCLAHAFWQRWIKSYLPTLTKRSKWFHRNKPLEVGDIVLVLEEGLPRGCWPKGTITEANPSADGEVRRVRVKLGNGKVLERPAVKVAKLNVEKTE